jgi:site-specific recombinase XerD
MASSLQEPLSPPLDLSHHFSRTTKNRQASSIKSFYRFFQIPGIGNLAGGEWCMPTFF